jgi:hypothetical protein
MRQEKGAEERLFCRFKHALRNTHAPFQAKMETSAKLVIPAKAGMTSFAEASKNASKGA